MHGVEGTYIKQENVREKYPVWKSTDTMHGENQPIWIYMVRVKNSCNCMEDPRLVKDRCDHKPDPAKQQDQCSQLSTFLGIGIARNYKFVRD